jgi:hypothetical protein
MNEETRERASAEFMTTSDTDTLQTNFAKATAVNQAVAAGIHADKDMLERINQAPAKTLNRLNNTYSSEAVRAGSIKHRHNLPQFFNNESGIEDPADPEVIAEMAAARKPVSNKKQD